MFCPAHVFRYGKETGAVRSLKSIIYGKGNITDRSNNSQDNSIEREYILKIHGVCFEGQADDVDTWCSIMQNSRSSK